MLEYGTLIKAIRKSQHCQRNWDLAREIPPEDLEVFYSAMTDCPSKQNVAYYRVHMISNREVIEKIHSTTDGFVTPLKKGTTTNSQVLANLLVAFEETPVKLSGPKDALRNTQTLELSQTDSKPSPEVAAQIERDRNMAVGIAAGYLNLTANLMGYATGCCACFEPDAIRETLGMSGQPLLLMGVGFKDETRNRRVHHLDNSFVFPTLNKQPIEVKIIK